MPLDILNQIPVCASKHHREHNQAGIWLHSWLQQVKTVIWYIKNTTEEPTGLCRNPSSLRQRAVSSLLSHISEWRMVIYIEKSVLAISETLLPSFFMACYGYDIYTEEGKDEILHLEQWTDWAQHYAQPGWSCTHLFSSADDEMMSSASSFPLPSGLWEWIALQNKTLSQKPSPAELNKSNFFTPKWKYMPSSSLILQRKCFTFDTAIKSKLS